MDRILFRFESTNNKKVKVTLYRIIGDGCIWEGISYSVSQSVSQPASQAVSQSVRQSVCVPSSFEMQLVIVLCLK